MPNVAYSYVKTIQYTIESNYRSICELEFFYVNQYDQVELVHFLVAVVLVQKLAQSFLLKLVNLVSARKEFGLIYVFFSNMMPSLYP